LRGGILDRVRASGARAHEIFIRYLVCRNFGYSVEVFAQLGHQYGEVLRILENFRQGLTSNLHFRQLIASSGGKELVQVTVMTSLRSSQRI